MTETTVDDEPMTCSARGCRADATWSVRWNNPAIHTPERRKVWLACDDHRVSLEEYLSVRSFWRDTITLEAQLAADAAAER